MKWLRVLRWRVRALLGGARLDRELEEEMRFHVDMVAAEYERAGHSPREARRRALVDFGGLDRKKQQARESRGVRWAEDFAQDVRYGLRMLRRSPVFTVVAVLSLGLGIGANTAVFSLVNAVLLRTLPVPSPQELRVINWTGTDADISISGSYSHPEGQRLAVADAVSYPVFEAIRAKTEGRASVFGFVRLPEIAVQSGTASYAAYGLMVSDNFFDGLEVGAALGRVFRAGEPEAGAEGEVVIGDAWWERRFGRDPSVVGRAITLNRQPFTVIGVLPAGVHGLQAGDAVDFYVPMASQPLLTPFWSRTSESDWWVQMMARLGPGTNEAQFRTMVEATFVSAAEGIVTEPGVLVYDGSTGLKGVRDRYRRPLLVLFAIVLTVILIACANLAGLSLARGMARSHEFAIRPALGASRSRLLRQSLTESVLLAALGATAGLALAYPVRGVLAGLMLGSGTGLRVDTALDLRVLSFTMAIALIAAALSGLLPALRAAGVDPMTGLKDRAAVSAPRLRAGRVLVVGQMALSILLLVGAGLYGRTLYNLTRIDPGFETDHLLVFRLDPTAAGYAADRRNAFFDDVERSLAAIPGVQGVAFSQMPLLTGWMSGGSFFSLPDHPQPEDAPARANRHIVNESYFGAMGIPIRVGRGFRRTDADGSTGVIVVNEAFARKYFDGQNPLGQRLRMDEVDYEVVGVSGDAKYADVKEDTPPTVYFTRRQTPAASGYLAVRTRVPPLSLVDDTRAAVATVDPGVPLTQIQTQEQMRAGRMAQERLFAWLCGSLAGLALLLCCIGLYGLMAYNVRRRFGEIGVRVALGATRRTIAGAILREAVLMAVAGLVIGVPIALALVRLIRSQLFGVEPFDPLTLGLGAALLLGVALVAVGMPARRAARIDPADALRAE
ncbi:MAG: ABC transporter permease [Gemmatimonadota bacterium]|jgi:predicted permease